jgi:hypothetical protein
VTQNLDSRGASNAGSINCCAARANLPSGCSPLNGRQCATQLPSNRLPFYPGSRLSKQFPLTRRELDFSKHSYEMHDLNQLVKFELLSA